MPHFLIEIFSKRPYLTIILVWSLLYVPLAFLMDSQFPDDTRTYTIDDKDLTNNLKDTSIYMQDERGLVVMVNLSYASEHIDVQVEDGYVPMNLELVGWGRLYTSDDYDARRVWKLGLEKVRYINGSDNLTLIIDVVSDDMVVAYHRDKGSTILDGKTIYKDFPSHDPPLMDLVWVVPCLLGGQFVVFRLYVSLFVLFSAMVLMKGWREEGKFRMVGIGALVVLNPLSVYSTLVAVQTGGIILLLASLALALFKMKSRLASSVMTGIGVSGGLFPSLLVPGLLAGRDSFLNRSLRTALAIIIGVVPFIVIRGFAKERADHFFLYVVSGGWGHPLEGISFWRFLAEVGVPSFVVLPGLLFISLIVLNLTVSKGKLGPFFTGLLMTLLFLTLYPNIPAGSFLILMAFVPFFWELGIVRNLIFSLCVGAMALDIMAISPLMDGYTVLIPSFLAIAMLMVMTYLMVRVYGSRSLFEARLQYSKY